MTDPQTLENLVGRKIVFTYYDGETHERLHLAEGEVQLLAGDLVRISSRWYRRKNLTLEAVLPVGDTDAIQE